MRAHRLWRKWIFLFPLRPICLLSGTSNLFRKFASCVVLSHKKSFLFLFLFFKPLACFDLFFQSAYSQICLIKKKNTEKLVSQGPSKWLLPWFNAPLNDNYLYSHVLFRSLINIPVSRFFQMINVCVYRPSPVHREDCQAFRGFRWAAHRAHVQGAGTHSHHHQLSRHQVSQQPTGWRRGASGGTPSE